MALFSMRVQVISRKDGRSAVGASAYRAGVALTNAAGERFDYTAKDHVELARIMAPEAAPEWVFERETLWQRAEAAEVRKDAQLAREIRIMLPREFSPDQRVNVVTDFVKREFNDRGMVADIAWHNPQASDGGRNPHAHVMLTMRPLLGDGFGKKSEGGRASQTRTTDWNRRELYEGIRKSWEDSANATLALMGSEARIDRRSYFERGVAKLPQPYLGVAVRVRELKSRMAERYNQWIAHRATSRAWGFAKKALDGQMRRLENRMDKVAHGADLFDRFVAWIDQANARLSGPKPESTQALHEQPNERGPLL